MAEPISNEQKDILLKYLDGKSLSVLEFTKRMKRIFNLMDKRCKQMAISNPGRPMAEYCERCQKKMTEILEG